jgi:hypothetical protein
MNALGSTNNLIFIFLSSNCNNLCLKGLSWKFLYKFNSGLFHQSERINHVSKAYCGITYLASVLNNIRCN